MNAPLTSSPTPPTRPQEAIQRLVDDHGICHLIFDTPGSAANIFTRETMSELDRHIQWIATSSDIKGVLIRSAKPRIFIAGANLHTMLQCPPAEIGDLIATGQRVFLALEKLPVPKIAAIHGACLGGGFELTLACNYRIASDDPATRIGLPETQLGLIPAWGGSTRLPKLIGVRGACHVILKGTAFTASMARKHGLIDEIVPFHCLLKHAVEWLMHPEPTAHHSTMDRFVAPVIRGITRGHLQRSTHGNYPALPAALDLISRAPWRSMEDSLTAERRAFESLIREPGSRNLIRLFFARERAKKRRVPGVASRIQNVAIIGAGIMGCGIAYWLATRGRSVMLTDINTSALAAAEQRLRTACGDAVHRHLLTKTEAQAVMDRIVLALNDTSLRRADLVIEAAIENPDIKRKLFADVAKQIKPGTLIASNTSAIPLAGLLENPSFIGLHFFNPVHAMPLVEIIRPANASDDAVATAVQFVQDIGKLPIVVKDSPGFLINRVLMPCLLEAAGMVDAGASIVSVDQAMLSFGMPMGPLRLLDEVGLDVALHVVKTLATAFPNMASIPPSLEERVRLGALGRKSGRGYYDYPKDKGPVPTDHLKIQPRDVAEAQRRLPLLLTNEAAHCLDEGIAESAADIDLGMVLGTGYAPFRGGPLRHADAVGLETIVAELRRLEIEFGPLYSPAGGLVERVNHHQTYHSEEPNHENTR